MGLTPHLFPPTAMSEKQNPRSLEVFLPRLKLSNYLHTTRRLAGFFPRVIFSIVQNHPNPSPERLLVYFHTPPKTSHYLIEQTWHCME